MVRKKKSMLRKIINLSPLVDVFMIVIFWYIMFSNQNMQTQENISSNTIEGLKLEIGKLERDLGDMEEQKSGLDEYIKQLLEELEKMNARAEELETENRKLTQLMEKEGQYLILRLKEADTANDDHTLEISFGEEIEKITFNREEREKQIGERMKNKILQYLKEYSRVNILLIYNGSKGYRMDIEKIQQTLEEIKKENYFIYTEKDISK